MARTKKSFSDMVEELEDHEDMVECKECFELFPKADCMKAQHGYICPTCGKGISCPDFIPTSRDITIDLYDQDFPEYESTIPAPDSIKSIFDTLIEDELEAIEGYDIAEEQIQTARVAAKDKDRVLDTLAHIKEEEEEHIDELREFCPDCEVGDVDEALGVGAGLALGGAAIGAGMLGSALLDSVETKDGEEDLDELFDADIKLGIDGGKDNKVSVLSSHAPKKQGRELDELFDIDVDLGLHGGTGNDVSVLSPLGGLTSNLKRKGSKKTLDEVNLPQLLKDADFDGTADGFLAKAGVEDGKFFDDFETQAEQDRRDPTTRNSYMRRIHNSKTRHKNLQESCEWTCVFDGKEIGSVEASSEEEAAEKMQKKYPEYHYGAYDGCFEVFRVEEALSEHVNRERPAIESEQELKGIDNAVVKCKAAKVVSHSKDEVPVDCTGKKKPLNKSLTRSKFYEAEETPAVQTKNTGEKTTAKQTFAALKNAPNYEAFVEILNKDKKSQAFIKFLQQHYKLEDSEIETVKKANPSEGIIACKELVPTQANISLSKSLGIVKDTDPNCWAVNIINNSENAFKDPTIVYAGKYIIDGHHRWSKAYALNGGDCTIKVLNFPAIPGVNWEDMLKATQLAIVYTNPEAKLINPVESDNMLTLPPKQIATFVFKKLSDTVFNAMKAKGYGNTKEACAKKTAANCEQMKQTSQPVPNAPARDFMPQTDKAAVAKLSSAVIDLTEADYRAKYPKDFQEHISDDDTLQSQSSSGADRVAAYNAAQAKANDLNQSVVYGYSSSNDGSFKELELTILEPGYEEDMENIYDDFGVLYVAYPGKDLHESLERACTKLIEKHQAVPLTENPISSLKKGIKDLKKNIEVARQLPGKDAIKACDELFTNGYAMFFAPVDKSKAAALPAEHLKKVAKLDDAVKAVIALSKNNPEFFVYILPKAISTGTLSGPAKKLLDIAHGYCAPIAKYRKGKAVDKMDVKTFAKKLVELIDNDETIADIFLDTVMLDPRETTEPETDTEVGVEVPAAEEAPAEETPAAEEPKPEEASSTKTEANKKMKAALKAAGMSQADIDKLFKSGVIPTIRKALLGEGLTLEDLRFTEDLKDTADVETEPNNLTEAYGYDCPRLRMAEINKPGIAKYKILFYFRRNKDVCNEYGDCTYLTDFTGNAKFKGLPLVDSTRRGYGTIEDFKLSDDGEVVLITTAGKEITLRQALRIASRGTDKFGDTRKVLLALKAAAEEAEKTLNVKTVRNLRVRNALNALSPEIAEELKNAIVKIEFLIPGHGGYSADDLLDIDDSASEEQAERAAEKINKIHDDFYALNFVKRHVQEMEDTGMLRDRAPAEKVNWILTSWGAVGKIYFNRPIKALSKKAQEVIENAKLTSDPLDKSNKTVDCYRLATELIQYFDGDPWFYDDTPAEAEVTNVEKDNMFAVFN